MRQIKKILLVTLLSFLTLPAFANVTEVYVKQKASPEAWEIKKQDDGYVFVLEDPNKFIIHVNDTTSEGKPSDFVTVTCNGKNNRMGPNTTLTCYGNFEDTFSLFVKKQDFHNGAAGTSLLTPKD